MPRHVTKGLWFRHAGTQYGMGTAWTGHARICQNQDRGWSIGVNSSRTHRFNRMAGIHPIPWGGTGTKQVMFGFPMHRPNVLSRFGNSRMLVVFSLSGIQHSGLRTGSTNNTVQLETDVGLRNRHHSAIRHRSAKAGVGLSERVARQSCTWVKFGG